MADVGSLINGQKITENWPNDYLYHPLMDESGAPATVRVGNEFFGAWLKREAVGGAFDQIILLNQEQLGRLYELRPPADRPNEVVPTGRKVYIDDTTGQKWPEEEYERVFYNVADGKIVAEAAAFDGNAVWLDGGRVGPRPFNNAVFPKNLIADGKISEADLAQRLPKGVRVEDEFALDRTADSALKASAELVLLEGRMLSLGQLEQARSGLAEPTLTYVNARAAEAAGISYEQGLNYEQQGQVLTPEEAGRIVSDYYSVDSGHKPQPGFDGVNIRAAGEELERRIGGRAAAGPVEVVREDSPPVDPAPVVMLPAGEIRFDPVDPAALDRALAEIDAIAFDMRAQVAAKMAGIMGEEERAALLERLRGIDLAAEFERRLEAGDVKPKDRDAFIQRMREGYTQDLLGQDLSVGAVDIFDRLKPRLEGIAAGIVDDLIAGVRASTTDAFNAAVAARAEAGRQLQELAENPMGQDEVLELAARGYADQLRGMSPEGRELYRRMGNPVIDRALELLKEEEASRAPSAGGGFGLGK